MKTRKTGRTLRRRGLIVIALVAPGYVWQPAGLASTQPDPAPKTVRGRPDTPDPNVRPSWATRPDEVAEPTAVPDGFKS